VVCGLWFANHKPQTPNYNYNYKPQAKTKTGGARVQELAGAGVSAGRSGRWRGKGLEGFFR